MAKALTSTSLDSDPFTYAEAMDRPQQDTWKPSLGEECTSIVRNKTFPTINSQEAKQLRVKPICSKWVDKTKHNPDGTIRYTGCLLIEAYNQTYFGETYATFRKLTSFRYLISLVRKHGWNIGPLDEVTAFLNPEVDDDDIYVTLLEGWPEGLNSPTTISRQRKALHGLNNHHHFSTMILTSSCFLSNSQGPRPTPTPISVAMVFRWYL